MTELREFEILFDDLTKESQKRLCKEFKTSPEEENWEIIPIAYISREIETIETNEE